MHERDALPVLTPEQVAAATDPAAAVALLATLGAPKRTSYSALAAYDACPYRYVLRFLLRIPGPPVAADRKSTRLNSSH